VSRLRPTFEVYLRLISAAGLALLVALPLTGTFGPLDLEFWLLAGLVLLGELYPIQVHGQIGEETFSTPFGFAMLLVYGAPEVAIVQAASSLAADLIRRRPADRIVFNLAQLTISWALAGAVLEAAGGTGLSRDEGLEASQLPAIALSALVFFAANSTLVRTAEALQQHVGIAKHLVGDLLFRSWSAGTLFVLGPPVAVIAENWLYLVPALALPMAAVHVASQQASAMERLALYDTLTSLPNRSLLSQRAQQAMGRVGVGRQGVALLTLDLDRFRDVNDTLGRPQGDALLVQVAERLERSMRSSDTVARIGADEFGVLLPGVLDRSEAEGATRKLLATLGQPFEVAGAGLSVDASCGIALFPEHGDDAELLLQHAEAAMYRAKRAQSGFELYAPEMDREAPRRLILVTALKRAIDAGAIELHYQPKIELVGRTVVGVEALARWTDPGLGSVPPSVFVPLTEMTGLAGAFTQLTLEMATADCRRFRDAGVRIPVALNVSPRVLLDPAFPRSVEAQLRRDGLDGEELLEIEITENTLMGDHEAARTALANLRAIGVRISIDDFGTGYSSFAYLSELAVHTLKIDRSFVSRLSEQGEQGDAEAILRSIIELARNLGLATVAEGVERPEVCDRLAALGCDCVQGFALARPMTADAVLAWIAAGQVGSRSPRDPV
jgi:diguanylate cyclase (GGDEF)-like protein